VSGIAIYCRDSGLKCGAFIDIQNTGILYGWSVVAIEYISLSYCSGIIYVAPEGIQGVVPTSYCMGGCVVFIVDGNVESEGLGAAAKCGPWELDFDQPSFAGCCRDPGNARPGCVARGITAGSAGYIMVVVDGILVVVAGTCVAPSG